MLVSGWRLPDHPLRGSAVTAKVVGFIVVVGVALVARAAVPLGGLYPLKAGALFALVSVLAIGFLGANHPFSQFGPGNQITTARAMLVALVASLIGEPGLRHAAASAAGASLVVVALDGVDGWLARRSNMASHFGARFDMEVDALLILVLSILAWRYGKAGGWVVLSGALRYAFVGAGWFVPRIRLPLPPSRRRQSICVLQVVGLSLVVMPLTPPGLSSPLAAAIVGLLCYSFAVDVWWLWRQTSAAEPSETLIVEARGSAR
jgi:phosphatidylglycerophosphate synthase